MITTPDVQLSQELQELYLENKEWMSQLLFLEDEYRFFHQLFEARSSEIAKTHTDEELVFVSNNLAELKNQLVTIKELIEKHQHLLESILKDNQQRIGLALLEETSTIATKITAVFAADLKIKKELFQLIGAK